MQVPKVAEPLKVSHVNLDDKALTAGLSRLSTLGMITDGANLPMGWNSSVEATSPILFVRMRTESVSSRMPASAISLSWGTHLTVAEWSLLIRYVNHSLGMVFVGIHAPDSHSRSHLVVVWKFRSRAPRPRIRAAPHRRVGSIHRSEFGLNVAGDIGWPRRSGAYLIDEVCQHSE